ncbi:MAG TPA: hypothetical protein VKO66_08215 [Sideroxyarcus sp.]|nr:hypothetical protein [Sideroxyarcus sp.]
MARRKHYHVYVIELSKDVLYEGRFKRCNPNYIPDKPCVYVGMTGTDPDVRFDKHKAGIQSNRYVKEYGLRLLPDLYEAFNPMSYDEARDKEVEVGIDLREAGFLACGRHEERWAGRVAKTIRVRYSENRNTEFVLSKSIWKNGNDAEFENRADRTGPGLLRRLCPGE